MLMKTKLKVPWICIIPLCISLIYLVYKTTLALYIYIIMFKEITLEYPIPDDQIWLFAIIMFYLAFKIQILLITLNINLINYCRCKNDT